MSDDKRRMKNKAITEYVEKVIIPIIFDYTDNNGNRTAGTYGTGTLFQFNEKSYLITAGHVIKDIDKIKEFIGIPLGRVNAQVYTFGGCRFHYPSDPKIREKYDVGIVELTDDIVQELIKRYCFLSYGNVSKVHYDRDFYISGYPFSYSKLDNQQDRIIGKPFRFMSMPKRPESSDFKYYDPSAHILIKYSDVHYANGIEQNKEVAPQKLGGISGCSVWNYIDETEGVWTPEKCLKVIGIQSTMKEENWLKAIKWGYVVSAFKEIDKGIYQKLESIY